MKNKKKVKTAVIVAAAVTGVAGAGVAGVTYIRKNNSKAVEVTPVATLNMGDMLSMGSYWCGQGQRYCPHGKSDCCQSARCLHDLGIADRRGNRCLWRQRLSWSRKT